MRTYFEPNYNGIDESFSNLVSSPKITSTVSPTTLISPTLTTTMTSAPKTTTTSTPTSTSTPRNPVSPTVTSPVPTTYTASAPKTTPTSTNTPTVNTPSIPEAPMPMGGYGGGGGAIMSGGEEGMTQGEDAFKKTGGINEELIFGFKRNHVYGLGLLALGGFIYFKYIKK